MANTIKIKRSASTAAPSTISAGELAYSEASTKLYYGAIAGSNAYQGCDNIAIGRCAGYEMMASDNILLGRNAGRG